MGTLHDKYLPEFDVSKTHEILVYAPPEQVWPTVDTSDFSRSRLIYILFLLRGLPVPESLSVKGMEQLNFIRLETDVGHAFIFGIIGQFWSLAGNLQSFAPEEFVGFQDERFAKATCHFEVIPQDNKQSIVRTETRIHCPTDRTRRRFKNYWRFIGPFSGLTRIEMLKAIKKAAESDDSPGH